MSLVEKIIKLYSSLTTDDFHPFRGTIILQDDSDGNGAYIKQWNHPTLPKPTQKQLDEIK